MRWEHNCVCARDCSVHFSGSPLKPFIIIIRNKRRDLSFVGYRHGALKINAMIYPQWVTLAIQSGTTASADNNGCSVNFFK
jgi:hypothetical protein